MTTEVTCKNCCSAIHKEAKICPFCLTPQNTNAALRRYIPALIIFVVIFAAFRISSSINTNRYEQPVSFAALKDNLVVESSELSFSKCGDCRSTFNAVTIGMIKNNTQHGWENFQIEVRFYNKDGKLIDSVSDTAYGLAVQPHSEVSFRVMERAAKATEEYASHKVIINDADQISDYY
ncbi:MAG: FxLYD domain-containing protein [Cellvibrio sp.]|uniref:FxLYD domain-containing protein n=1 Tax=Cellvibrio sp. TaxID=1965322 RepID=UPI00272143AC|nr:FxLYD domain-containing protein [Cellvibrio sp.]